MDKEHVTARRYGDGRYTRPNGMTSAAHFTLLTDDAHARAHAEASRIRECERIRVNRDAMVANGANPTGWR